MSLVRKWKQRWGITSTPRFWIIMLVFSLTGMTLVYVRRPVFDALGITAETPAGYRALAFICIGIPLYQLLLLAWGALFGQFRFFIDFEKKSLRRLAALIRRDRAPREAPQPSEPLGAPREAESGGDN